ncbi:hypothetical protein OFO01_03200 [Campylobacter sp. JMF_01 NE2]|uniref:hypothetical protein n=1 Tax=unclassified Campylobacter TaxID=2593542 RepID=UPI0022E9F95B|nr:MULTISPECIES: hypothetical protein [unclassified Campylobacter]MDA3052450.1 hypothetical protein [Campylobacter sp. JMF_03 NE3]MDA3066784.1 hypothetical protein [Campylobacter sp. JMF_01 NE2]MDA3074072.1 hypothetical protein [Campylobacter sp. JMF_10 EL2]
MTILSAFMSLSAFAKDNCELDIMKNIVLAINNEVKIKTNDEKATMTARCEDNMMIFDITYKDKYSDEIEKSANATKLENAKKEYLARNTLDYCFYDTFGPIRQYGVGIFYKISTKNMKNVIEFSVRPQDCEPNKKS